MADEKLIMDIAFGRVDASAITKALTSEFGKVFESAKVSLGSATGGEGKGGSGKGGGGDILAVLELIFGALIQDLAKIINALISVSTILLAVSLIIKILADTVGAFWAGFRNVTKVWDAIFQLISKLVEPFVNLLIPLLIPVLHLLAIMARIVNAVLMPIFQLLMKAFTPKGDTLQTAFKQIAGGDLLGGVMTIIKAVAEQFAGLKDQISSKVMVALDLLRNWLLSFLTIDLGPIHDVIDNIFGKELGGVLNMLIDTIYNVISGLIGFLAQIAGKGIFDKIMGEGKFDEVKSKNQGFAAGADMAKAIQDFVTAIVDFVTSVWPTVVDTVNGFIENLPMFAFAIGSFLSTTWKNLIDDLNKVHTETWPALKTALEAMIKAINYWSSFNFVQFVKDLASQLLPHSEDAQAYTAKDLGGGGFTHDDFVMRPGQGAVSFSPNDTLIGVKDPSSLGGGGRGNTTINIYGNGDKYLADMIKETMSRTESNQSRGGYYQKGW